MDSELSTGDVIRCQEWSCTNTQTAEGEKFKRCAKCGVHYCSRECQVKDWKKAHKSFCEMLSKKRSGTFVKDELDIIVSSVRNVRIYVAPFTVSKYQQRGKGFVFMQSPSTLEDLSCGGHVTETGRRLDRNLSIGYFTLSEFKNKLLRDHPQLEKITSGLEELVGTYEPKEQIALLFIAGCGKLNLLTVQLVPDYNICKELAKDFDDQDMLKIGLDLQDDL